ncbi:MAG: NAD-dependent epimerase/dehydratase family protein [Chitinophagales bacterium]|nr:NAD-dependent epimerase/dehydratase family protein [Chitinophagales bacterium]
MKNKKAIIFGAAGFIGNHLVARLKAEGYWVRGVDLVSPKYQLSEADEFLLGDLRDASFVASCITEGIDELYQLAADMGGAGYVFTGENDANIMHNSALINLHSLELALKWKVKKIFFASSACIYPKHNQEDALAPICAEDSAYPAMPDSEYGWEKLFSERLYEAYRKNYGLVCKIARFHNIYGPQSVYEGGKEKAPAAICRKVALAKEGEQIEVWGTGQQTRSFLFIEDCLDAIRLFMDKDGFYGPINIGSTEMISINDLTKMVIALSGKSLGIKNIAGPVGVNGRSSDNALIERELKWSTQYQLAKGMQVLYHWIEDQLNKQK